MKMYSHEHEDKDTALCTDTQTFYSAFVAKISFFDINQSKRKQRGKRLRQNDFHAGMAT